MKQLHITFLITVLMSMAGAKTFAHDIAVTNDDGVTIYYIYINNNTELAVSFRGSSSSSYSNEYTGNIVIPESVTYNSKTYRVASIGQFAFYRCTGLTSVTIPNSVTSIGDSAFSGCTGLTSVEIPNSVTSIGANAFSGCTGLTSVEIPNSVTSIGESAFYGCTSLTSVTIPNSVTSIGRDAFYGCSGLTSVTIGNGVTSIGNYAFYNCTGLTSVEFHCKEIGSWFRGFSSIKSIIIGDEVTSIGANAFDGCTGLTSVEIPNSVTSIGANAFDGTAWYNNQPDGLVYAGKVAYKYKGTMPANTSIVLKEGTLGIAASAFEYCEGLTSVTIPNSVTSIYYDAFKGCTGLTSVTIPNSVTSIGRDAFYGCSGLTSVEIPNSVTSIGHSAFAYCSGLTSVEIPSSVTSIGDTAFYGCSGLTEVKVDIETPLTISSQDFTNRANATLYVPAGCKAAYEAADYWKEFKEIVESNNITFADANVKTICVANWDTNGDGELSEEEAAAVTDIGNVFQGKANITSFDELQFFTGLTSIGSYAFYGCSGLTSVTIGNSVTSIGQYAFRDCGGLTSVTIGNSVTSIGKFAFDDCRSLEKVIVQNIASWCNISFRENSTNPLYYAHHLYSDENTEITNLVIPNSVTSIGERAFIGCSDLTSVTIPNSVTSIGLYAFEKCSGLEKVIVEDLAAWCNISFDSGYSNPLSYAHHLYNNENTEITDLVVPNSVTSISHFAFDGCSGLTSVTIPNSVTSIGGSAFSGCIGLTSVNIPNSVTSIASLAFYRCSGLTSVTIPNSVTSIASYAFKGCSSLTSVTIPNSVTSIASSAFEGCSSLTSVTIPNSVSSLGSLAFQYCSSLTEVKVDIETPLTISSQDFTNRANATLYVPAGCKAAYEAADYWKEFKEIVEMPAPPKNITFADNNVKAICVANWDTNGDGELSEAEAAAVTSLGNVFKNKGNITSFNELQYFTGLMVIGFNAFQGCSGLTSVTIPNSVMGIGDDAFMSCSSLTSVEIPNSVTEIRSSAFNGCSSLTSMEIPNSVTEIGSSAFNSCSGLTEVTIPNSVTTIGKYAFSGCSGLTSMVVSSGNTKYDSRGNCNAIIETATNTLIVGCKNTVIPNSVTSIGNSAFGECTGLTSIMIPNSVTSIGEEAFFVCTGLTSITIPNSVTSIGGSAFWGCSGLTSVEIPNSVTSIGVTTFAGCSGLTSVTIPNSVTSIGYGAFESCTGLTSVVIPNSVTSIDSRAFYGCSGLTSVTIPNSVTSIGQSAFYGCSGLTEVTVDIETPLTISEDVFSNRANATLYVPSGCKAAYEAAQYWQDFRDIIDVAVGDVFTAKTKEGVDMSFMITSIGPLEVQVGEGDENYFGGKAAIDKTYAGKITIPSTVTIPGTNLTFTVSKVGVNAFNGCNYLTSVEMPLTIKEIEKYVFYGCKSLMDVVLPNSIKTIPQSLSIGYGTSQGYAPIDGVVDNIHVPSSVTWIGRYAINQCDKVIIEDDNTNLSLLLQDRNAKDGYYDGTFSHVKKLYVGRNTALNSTSKSDMVFCALNSTSTQLTDVIFGPLVTEAFTGWAFGNCGGVKSVTCLGKLPFTSPDFYQIPQTAVLYVPLGSKEQYASANGWKQFGNITEVTEVTITMDDSEMVYAGDFDLDFSNVDGLKAYTAGDFDELTSTITLNPIQLVSAGKGVILKGAKGTYTVPCANIEATTPDALCGTISGRFIRNTEDENVNYVFDKDEHVFKPVDAAYGCLVSRNGAYLSLPASSVSGNGDITPIIMEPTDISQLDNAIYIEPVEGLVGTTIPFEVKLKNTETPVGCSFRLTLPSGFSLACDGDGDIVYNLGTRAKKMSFTNKDWGNGTYDIALTPSTSSATISGNDGTVITFQLVIPDDVFVGDHALTLTRNLIQRKVDGVTQDLELADIVSKVTVDDYVLGDVNSDGNVTPSDAIMILYHYFEVDQNGFNAKAADINGDGIISPADAIEALYIYFGSGSSNAPMMYNNEKEPQ